MNVLETEHTNEFPSLVKISSDVRYILNGNESSICAAYIFSNMETKTNAFGELGKYYINGKTLHKNIFLFSQCLRK